jgi:hypothetical protein
VDGQTDRRDYGFSSLLQKESQKERQHAYKRDIEARSRNYCYRGKAISITYCDCVSVALLSLHAMRMRCVLLSSVLSLAVPYFPSLSHKRYDFRITFIEYKLWGALFYNYV